MGVKKGRPKSNPLDKKMPNGLTVDQWNRLKLEAQVREIPAAMLLRTIVDWYLRAIDLSREENADEMSANKIHQ